MSVGGSAGPCADCGLDRLLPELRRCGACQAVVDAAEGISRVEGLRRMLAQLGHTGMTDEELEAFTLLVWTERDPEEIERETARRNAARVARSN